MALYARHLGPTETMVAAADTMVEFEALLTKLGAVEGASFTHRLPDVMEMLTTEHLNGFARAPVLIEFQTASDQAAFAITHALVFLKPSALRDRAAKMVADATTVEEEDERTLAEIYGLDKHDPWDERTEEEKALAEAYKRKADDAKKKGNMMGESFGGMAPKDGDAPKDPSVRVTDVKMAQEEDGSVVITSAIARQKRAATDPASIPDDERIDIDHKSPIGIYFKVEVVGAKLADIIPMLAERGIDLPKAAVDLRNNSAGCWAAMPRKLLAEEIGEHLVGSGLTVEVYAIGKNGERVTPKGVDVVDEGAKKPEGARPWNEGAAEWEALDEEGRKALLKNTLRADQFLFCGWYDGAEKGTTVMIAPKSYFVEKREMWERESLPIQSLLPRDLKEVSPGVYKTLGTDFNHISAAMTGAGFIFSFPLQIWVNQQ